MVNPLASNVAPIAAGHLSTEPIRPAVLPEPARQVTPVGETISADTSADAPQDDPSLAASDPLEKALEQVNSSMQAWSTGLRFDFDDEAQRIVVSITSSDTGEVLRTVPSEAVIRVAKMIVSLQGQGFNAQA